MGAKVGTEWFEIPSYAADYPPVAKTVEQMRFAFYCCNCYRKARTTFVTPNFGPFCMECLTELVVAFPLDIAVEPVARVMAPPTSAQPCGCDTGAHWVCEEHRKAQRTGEEVV